MTAPTHLEAALVHIRGLDRALAAAGEELDDLEADAVRMLRSEIRSVETRVANLVQWASR